MPRRNIYIKKEDMELFEQAETMGNDNLSAVIAEALKIYVERKKAEAQGMKEYAIEVGFFSPQGSNNIKTINFVGRLLAEGKDNTDEGRNIYFAVYQTKAGKIIVFWRNESQLSKENSAADYAVLDYLPRKDEKILGEVTAGFVMIPEKLLEKSAKAMKRIVEYID